MATDDETAEAVSCTSYFWPYIASDMAGFEARRAVTHLARNSKSGTTVKSSTIDDMLPYVRAANEIAEAASVALRDVVADVRRHGASWADVSAQLDVGATAAQKRFGRPGKESVPIDAEAIDLGIMIVSAANHARDSDLDVEVDWSEPDISPEVFFKASVHRLIRYAFEFENVVYGPYRKQMDSQQQFMMPEDWWTAISRIAGGLKTGVWDLARSGSIGEVAGRGGRWPIQACYDVSPGLYLSLACFRAAMAVTCLDKLGDHLKQGALDEFHNSIEAVSRYLQDMVDSFIRPECMALIQVVNYKLSNNDEEEETGT